jgi:AraC-like DNA-binding protein
MKLAYVAPPTDLTPYISAYYLFESDAPSVEDIERADIAQVRYFLEGSGEVHFPDGSQFSNHPVTIFGPRMCASRITAYGPTRVFGFGLLPTGWAAVTGLPADKHINSIVDAATLFGQSVDDLRTQLAGLTTVEDMAAVMNEVSRHFYKQAQAVPHWFTRAVDGWLEAHISPDIADLETATGLSRRQIERLCKKLYGAPPKTLVRKYRALRTANAIARGKGDWQDFIDDAYYDQSHCIREIKEFIGITPSAVRAHVSPLTNMTFDRSNLMGDISTLSAQT